MLSGLRGHDKALEHHRPRRRRHNPAARRDLQGQTGTEFVIEKAGTGATLEKAKGGDFDMVVVHARALEDKFIAEGYGQNRRDIMYNDFVILGPKDDPAESRE